MRPHRAFVLSFLLAAMFLCRVGLASDLPASDAWKTRHDQLVLRLRNLVQKESAFGAAYRPLYHAAIPWYELWGGRDQGPVDDDMVSPEAYADELAGALENGRNFFADNPGALFPLVFSGTLPGGKAVGVNYWLSLPAGFPDGSRSFPLVVDLHGSGWLGHKISFKRHGRAAGPAFSVTPINMGGPWQIDFLNAYLDQVLSILPVDQDRVYVQGHSLGAMATWEWALDNPERFAAISPRAGIGEPYRAQRLKRVPAWVIHGENDKVISSGYADQMVTALQSQGASVRFSIIKGGEHNMPSDLDQGQILDWYLKQTRSHLPSPEDPRDQLRLNAGGFSPWEVVMVPETPSWKSQASGLSNVDALRAASAALFQRAHARGELVDSPIRREVDAGGRPAALWLAVPRSLHAAEAPDPSIVPFPAMRVVRFYFRGIAQRAADHLKVVAAESESAGQPLTGKYWITSLSIAWQDSPAVISEYWLEVK
jgi:pimeloyl-ACP methyl ester carboxylesterase